MHELRHAYLTAGVGDRRRRITIRYQNLQITHVHPLLMCLHLSTAYLPCYWLSFGIPFDARISQRYWECDLPQCSYVDLCMGSSTPEKVRKGSDMFWDQPMHAHGHGHGHTLVPYAHTLRSWGRGTWAACKFFMSQFWRSGN